MFQIVRRRVKAMVTTHVTMPWTLTLAKFAPLSSQPSTFHYPARFYTTGHGRTTGTRQYSQRPILTMTQQQQQQQQMPTTQYPQFYPASPLPIPLPEMAPVEPSPLQTRALRNSYIFLLACAVFFAYQVTEDVMKSELETAQLKHQLATTHALLLDLQQKQSATPTPTSTISQLPTSSQQIQVDGGIENGNQSSRYGLVFSSGQLHHHLEQIPAIHHLTHLPHYHHSHMVPNQQQHQQHQTPGIIIYQPTLTQPNQQQQQLQSQHQHIFVPVNHSNNNGRY